MPRHYEAGILKFDNEIIRIVAMCQNLRRKIDDLTTERNEIGNDFSAKLLNNEQMAPLIEHYSEIVRSYETACKEFSQLDSDLEKIMAVEDDAQELIGDVKKTLEEMTSNFNFKTDFNEAQAYISEVLTPTVDRIIEAGQAIHVKAQDALVSFNPPKGKFDDAMYKILKGTFWLLPGIGGALFIYGFFTKHEGLLAFGSIMLLSSLILFVALKFERHKEQKLNK